MPRPNFITCYASTFSFQPKYSYWMKQNCDFYETPGTVIYNSWIAEFNIKRLHAISQMDFVVGKVLVHAHKRSKCAGGNRKCAFFQGLAHIGNCQFREEHVEMGLTVLHNKRECGVSGSALVRKQIDHNMKNLGYQMTFRSRNSLDPDSISNFKKRPCPTTFCHPSHRCRVLLMVNWNESVHCVCIDKHCFCWVASGNQYPNWL